MQIRILSFLFSLLLISITAFSQQDESVDTIIVIDPVTYEETVRIVRSSPGESCYNLMYGALPIEISDAGKPLITMSRETAIENIQEGISISVAEGCTPVSKFKEYNVEVYSENGKVVSYTFDQMQEYFNSFPAAFERILFNAEGMIFKGVKIELDDGSTKDIGDFTVLIE